MKVINIKKRIIHQPKEEVAALISTLATKNDLVWPYESWPAMRFKDGLKLGSKGGHGIVRYAVEEFDPGNYIKFRFSKPDGFLGFHEFILTEISPEKTELCHAIRMDASGIPYLKWILAIRWLHEALLTDALDKVENHFTKSNNKTEYNAWVKFLRSQFKPPKAKA